MLFFFFFFWLFVCFFVFCFVFVFFVLFFFLLLLFCFLLFVFFFVKNLFRKYFRGNRSYFSGLFYTFEVLTKVLIAKTEKKIFRALRESHQSAAASSLM